MVTKNYSSLSQVRNCGLLLLAIDIILYNGALFAKLVLLKKSLEVWYDRGHRCPGVLTSYMVGTRSNTNVEKPDENMLQELYRKNSV